MVCIVKRRENKSSFLLTQMVCDGCCFGHFHNSGLPKVLLHNENFFCVLLYIFPTHLYKQQYKNCQFGQFHIFLWCQLYITQKLVPLLVGKSVLINTIKKTQYYLLLHNIMKHPFIPFLSFPELYCVPLEQEPRILQRIPSTLYRVRGTALESPAVPDMGHGGRKTRLESLNFFQSHVL